MQLDITRSYNPHLFTPFQTHGRKYILLFHEKNLKAPFFVRDSNLVLNTMFFIGEIAQGSYEGQTVGSIFYTQSPLICEGSFALAYSGVLKQGANTARFKARDLGMSLVLKTEHFYIYDKINVATLLVNPKLKTSIRQNFEV